MENEPYNRDVLYLLIDCCIESQNAAGAEKAVIKLVEIEPANYPKFLDLIRIYLNANDAESAARILTMSSEYLLAAGQADECSKWISEILERDANQLTGLRLLVRYNSFLNDENGFRLALERLCSAASAKGSIEDERYALAQLVVIRPHETRYKDRLHEINEKYGFEDSPIDEELLRAQFVTEPEPVEEAKEAEAGDPSLNGHSPHDLHGDEPDAEVIEAEIIHHLTDADTVTADAEASPLSPADEQKVQKELDSIAFYIENDYNELAEKALAELTNQYGDRPEFAAFRNRIGAEVVANAKLEIEHAEVVTEHAEVEYVANTLGIDEIRSEFGLEEGADESENSDYDTHYHTAVAYQEMGLLEEAIHEFQEAIGLTEPHDGTRRFFQCANLLGHCFLQKGKSNHAITWFGRALEAGDVSDWEQHGLWYEIALAYETSGDEDNAAMYFDKIYAENVDFRDVSERVKNLTVSH
jgi:tetratricopeptide (TPR) repeat protein